MVPFRSMCFEACFLLTNAILKLAAFARAPPEKDQSEEFDFEWSDDEDDDESVRSVFYELIPARLEKSLLLVQAIRV